MFHHSNKYWYIGGLIIYSFLNILVLNGDRLYSANMPAQYLFVVITFLCSGIWFANLFIQENLSIRWPQVHSLVVQFAISIVFVMLLSVISVLLTSTFLGQPFNFIQKNVLLTAGFTFRVNLFLNTVNAVYYFNKKYQEKALETQKLRMDSLAAKYKTLNNQINPHFFFNNLNTLSALIHTDPKKADHFLQKMSDMYRYLLDNRSEDLVPLEEELRFLKEYIELLSIRFGNALKFRLQLEGNERSWMIPPTALQILVENVVKHNFFTSAKPINVLIRWENEEITILNELQPKKIKDTSFGIGLKNIRSRYQFFGKEILVNETANEFRVTIPLISTANEVVDIRG